MIPTLQQTKQPKKWVVVSRDYSGLGFAKHLLEEGNEVLLATRPKDDEENLDAYDLVGEGIVDKTSLDDLMDERKKYKDWYFLWDQNHNYEEADLLRKEGFKVFGGSELTYKMEHDRKFGTDIVDKAGLDTPPTHEFTSIQDGIDFLLESEDKAFVFKPDESEGAWTTYVPDNEDDHEANEELVRYMESQPDDGTSFILQERIKGLEYNIEIWVYQGKPFFAFCCLESKRKLNKDEGEMVGCFDRETEIMTSEGWKRFEDLTGKELVANQKQDGSGVIYSPILENIRYNYKGKMHQYLGKRYDLLMTPNHKLWGDISHETREGIEKNRGFVESKDLKKSYWIDVPLAWNNQGFSPEYIEIPENVNGRYISRGMKVNMVNWARFLGLWTAEGWITKNRTGNPLGVVGIAQKKFIKECQEIIDKIPTSWTRIKNGWVASNVALGKFIYQHSNKGTYEKVIPSYIKNGSKEVIEAFLDGFILGDGSVDKNTGKKSLYTSNRKLADQLQELIIKSGKWASIRIREPRQYTIRGKSGWSREQYELVIQDSGHLVIDKDGSRGSGCFEEIDFDDDVFCVSTLTQVILIRRNGKAQWIGNCSQDISFTIPLESKIVQDTVAKLLPDFKDYTGFLDMNILVKDKKNYFLEFCARFGYSAHPNLFWNLAISPVSDILSDFIDGKTDDFYKHFRFGFGASITLYIDHPVKGLPFEKAEHLQGHFYHFDTYLDGEEYRLAGYANEVGIVTAWGYTITDAAKECLRIADKIKYPCHAMRTDLDLNDYPSNPRDRYLALDNMGYLDKTNA